MKSRAPVHSSVGRDVLRTSPCSGSRKSRTVPVKDLGGLRTRIEKPHALSPSTSGLFVSLGGSQRPLFFVHPNLRTARHIVGTETLSPCLLSHSLQWRSKVAPSFSSSCLHRALRFSMVAPKGVRPGVRGGPIFPVCLLKLRYLSRVGIETPKVLTTSFLGMPRSTAASTFSLRSSE